ncbi:Histidine kinase [Pseudomonas sp. IT-347P]|uniref:XopAW family type III secretion system calcium-binding effector n=1 Tax=Pseudomonas sp. IT-347P TaxID=3026458 RepID=UPI0039DFB124
MIGSVSNYASYTSASNTTTQNTRSPQLQKELFAKLDSNGDGAVDQDELSSGLISAGSTADSNEIYSALDKNKDGTVSQDELTASLTPPPPPPKIDSDELFSQLDADGDGSVTATELSSALQTSNSTSSTSTDTSAALLNILDSDSSGGVSSDELKAALQAGRERPEEEQTASTQSTTEALNRMIANLSKQYSLVSAAPVGKYLNVAT